MAAVEVVCMVERLRRHLRMHDKHMLTRPRVTLVLVRPLRLVNGVEMEDTKKLEKKYKQTNTKKLNIFLFSLSFCAFSILFFCSSLSLYIYDD